ncbi:uncharacterized protein EI97DRAFT_153531 [Westerdykella ornata]|uniref:Uncharacterized protein n=1 Tax=Westerdykella ornata TaxID=318751 RepID=A0A6A6JAD7_WESOR|nr:uncharacterized protein EI97DRAFT_153531 [Westerdykella ornata]KAF2273551.1 hypothetical protein EI97DRAFT_153531 [Westerdykella ornata]
MVYSSWSGIRLFPSVSTSQLMTLVSQQAGWSRIDRAGLGTPGHPCLGGADHRLSRYGGLWGKATQNCTFSQSFSYSPCRPKLEDGPRLYCSPCSSSFSIRPQWRRMEIAEDAPTGEERMQYWRALSLGLGEDMAPLLDCRQSLSLLSDGSDPSPIDKIGTTPKPTLMQLTKAAPHLQLLPEEKRWERKSSFEAWGGALQPRGATGQAAWTHPRSPVEPLSLSNKRLACANHDGWR